MGRSSIISVPYRKPREANQGGTSTTETAFTSDGTLPVILPLPSAGSLAWSSGTTTAMFEVRAFGRVTGGTTTNFTAVLYYGTSATLASNTAIETTGAIAVNSISSNWFLRAMMVWDSTSNKINGVGHANIELTQVAIANLTNAVTSADPDDDSEQGFVVSWTFSAGNASNVAVLDGFVLEEL